MHPQRDSLMSCPCGRGDYLFCYKCPYHFCSYHGKNASPDKVAARIWWKIFMNLRDGISCGQERTGLLRHPQGL